jgi:hypothetical protein
VRGLGGGLFVVDPADVEGGERLGRRRSGSVNVDMICVMAGKDAKSIYSMLLDKHLID